MTDIEIQEIVQTEFHSVCLGVTEQYLQIHQPIYEGGIIKIDRIDREKDRNQIIAYLPVQDQYFYFAVYINVTEHNIQNIGTESRNIVRLKITSDSLTSTEMLSFTTLLHTQSWDKGDKRTKTTDYKFSGLLFEPNPEPDEFEDKLKKLLSFLDHDSTGISELISNKNVEA